MELRQYWNVIWKRRWLVLAIIVLAGAFSAYSFLTTQRTYELDTEYTVRYPQTAANGDNGTITDTPAIILSDYKGYYYYLSSEYQVDDFTRIVETDAFAEAVIKVMQERLSNNQTRDLLDPAKYRSDLEKLRPQEVVEWMGADRKHRELRLFIEAPSRDLAKHIMDAAGEVLTEARYQPVRGRFDDRPIFGQLDMVTYESLESSTSREVINAAIRLFMGIVAALAIVFLLEYLDNSVRDERDAHKVLDLPVIGAIPRT
jgi:capsular polysaccharide biosynthesis protein